MLAIVLLVKEARDSRSRIGRIFGVARSSMLPKGKEKELSYMPMDLDLLGEPTFFLQDGELTLRYQCSLGVAEEIASMAQRYIARPTTRTIKSKL